MLKIQSVLGVLKQINEEAKVCSLISVGIDMRSILRLSVENTSLNLAPQVHPSRAICTGRKSIILVKGILLYVRLIQTPLETIVQKRLKPSMALDHKQFDSP